MNDTPVIADRLLPLSSELYRFVTRLQKPRLADGKLNEAVRLKCHELREKIASVREYAADHRRAFSVPLERISRSLGAYAQELEESRNVVRLREAYRSLAQGYELLRVELEKFKKQYAVGTTVHLQRLKTDNYARNVFHVTMGLAGVLLYEYVLTYRQASAVIGSLFATFVLLEVLRRFLPQWNDFMVDRLFGAISRPWERHQTNSSTYYALGLLLVTLFFPKPVAQISALVLAVGDPMATLAGKRWGRRKVWREKTYVGVGVFILTSLAASVTFLLLLADGLTFGSKLTLALAVSLAGAFAELFSERIDDNLTIPIICAGVASFWFAA